MVNQMNTRVNQLELKVLYDISRIIGQALNLDQTLEIILKILSEYLAMKRATITLKGEEKVSSPSGLLTVCDPERRKEAFTVLTKGLPDSYSEPRSHLWYLI